MKLFKSLILIATVIIVGCADHKPKKVLNKKNSTGVEYKKSNFSDFKDWDKQNQLQSYNAFKISCKEMVDSTNTIYKKWRKVCTRVLDTNLKTDEQARDFFENNFTPYLVTINAKDTGKFTGYYELSIKGSLVKTIGYNVPIYKTPSNLVKVKQNNGYYFGRYVDDKLVPYYTREQIDDQNIIKDSDVLVWVKSKVDRTFLQIQGSGRILTSSGDILLGYDSQNGQPYKPIGKYLLDHHYMDIKEISMQSIKEWLYKNKDKTEEVLNYDPSFVFFRYIDANNPIGAQGVELTPSYSLAVDDDYHTYGTPMWLETSYSKEGDKQPQQLNRLMIAQDTGGAIRGPIRGDVFWGHEKDAAYNAGHMNNSGKLWILLPKKI